MFLRCCALGEVIMWCDLWEKAQEMLQRQFYHDISNTKVKGETLIITFNTPKTANAVSVILHGQHLTYREADERLPFNYKTSGNQLIITVSDKLQTVDLLENFKIISPEMANKLSSPTTPRAKVL